MLVCGASDGLDDSGERVPKNAAGVLGSNCMASRGISAVRMISSLCEGNTTKVSVGRTARERGLIELFEALSSSLKSALPTSFPSFACFLGEEINGSAFMSSVI